MKLREIKAGLLAKFLNKVLFEHFGRESLVPLLRIVNQQLILFNDRSTGIEPLGQ